MVVVRSSRIQPWLYIVAEQTDALAARFADVIERGDLEAVGALALFEALEDHDDRRHDGFPHYATCVVRGRMLRAISRELRHGQRKATLYGEATASFATGELVHEVNVVTAAPQRLLDAGREGCDDLVLAALIAGVSLGTASSSHEDLHDADEYRRAIGLVYRLLAALPDDTRTLVELLYVRGLTHAEAAKRLTVHRNTVAHRLRGALRSMREALIADGILCRPRAPPNVGREKSVWPSSGLRPPRGPPDSSRG